MTSVNIIFAKHISCKEIGRLIYMFPFTYSFLLSLMGMNVSDKENVRIKRLKKGDVDKLHEQQLDLDNNRCNFYFYS